LIKNITQNDTILGAKFTETLEGRWVHTRWVHTRWVHTRRVHTFTEAFSQLQRWIKPVASPTRLKMFSIKKFGWQL